MLIWGQFCCSASGPKSASKVNFTPKSSKTFKGLKIVLRLELLLHVGQLLDQPLEGDSPLGQLLPAFAHQLVHLLNTICIRPQVVKKKVKHNTNKLQLQRHQHVSLPVGGAD